MVIQTYSSHLKCFSIAKFKTLTKNEKSKYIIFFTHLHISLKPFLLKPLSKNTPTTIKPFLKNTPFCWLDFPTICHEFERFSTYLTDIKVTVFYGGVHIKSHKDLLKNECLHIVVGTPGRILALARDKDLALKNVRHFILDECDKMLESLDMRKDVQEIFKMTPHDKQVMMFSATLSKEIRPVCKKFMQDPIEIYVDDEAKLTLHGLVQHYIKLSELEINCKLNDLLDALDFNQDVIFVKRVSREAELNKLLVECNFPSICIHSGMSQEERLTRYKGFKEGHKRILVATDLVGRGIDIERVNIVINYDMPDSADTYLHRVGRAGRFGTKGLAITFVASAFDSDVLNQCYYSLQCHHREGLAVFFSACLALRSPLLICSPESTWKSLSSMFRNTRHHD
ncbi:hypothetical protein MKW98_005561 [Papaver atlanticum]|uniref:RNA helicase n=1 Tax=Papaver atlanticum TaxID=357466 RepID=A0AAD4STU5_9MAGN|nr:hypothetical protein MKW98_005561 [Papaver atlanticum]